MATRKKTSSRRRSSKTPATIDPGKLGRDWNARRTSDPVRNVQHALVKAGQLNPEFAVGVAGPRTVQALHRWRLTHGRNNDGPPDTDDLTGLGLAVPDTETEET